MRKLLRGGSYYSIFGVGPPGANVAQTAMYYDTTAAPYRKYVRHAGAWHETGPVVNIDADHIQGVPVVATAPTAGKDLKFDGADWTAT